jgi:DNA-directed RNA polymerase subunit RPC12/RpoP
MIYIEREYKCEKCGKGTVIHSDLTSRNKYCCYCGKPVTETGKTTELEGDFVVMKQDGVEFRRFPKKR